MQRVIAVVVVSLLAVYPAGCGNTRMSRAPVSTRSPSKVPVQSKPREASKEEREKYAEREVQSSGLEKFKGGGGVVTVLLIVVLVIVILILLKKI
jgi:hypothetical protein